MHWTKASGECAVRLFLFSLAALWSSAAFASDGQNGATSTASVRINVSVLPRAFQMVAAGERSRLCVAIGTAFALVDAQSGKSIQTHRESLKCAFGGDSLDVQEVAKGLRLVLVRPE